MIEDLIRAIKIREATEQTGGSYKGGVTPAECRQMIDKAMEDPKVKILIEELRKSGCPINPDKFIRPSRCLMRASAFFRPWSGILICCNHLTFQDEVTQGLIHELVHAYDDCRVKDMNWSNCYHQACAEIRANVVSGDCHIVREFLRGHRNLRGHEPECVRRRATASVNSNPNCSESMTKMALLAVWDTCYKDTKPFDKAP